MTPRYTADSARWYRDGLITREPVPRGGASKLPAGGFAADEWKVKTCAAGLWSLA